MFIHTQTHMLTTKYDRRLIFMTRFQVFFCETSSYSKSFNSFSFSGTWILVTWQLSGCGTSWRRWVKRTKSCSWYSFPEDRDCQQIPWPTSAKDFRWKQIKFFPFYSKFRNQFYRTFFTHKCIIFLLFAIKLGHFIVHPTFFFYLKNSKLTARIGKQNL